MVTVHPPIPMTAYASRLAYHVRCPATGVWLVVLAAVESIVEVFVWSCLVVSVYELPLLRETPNPKNVGSKLESGSFP